MKKQAAARKCGSLFYTNSEPQPNEKYISDDCQLQRINYVASHQ